MKLISRFVCRFTTSSALPETWWFLPPHKGGLGLTISDVMQSLQLHMLCKVSIAGDRPPSGKTIHSWAVPVTTTPNYAVSRRSTRWAALRAYWHSVLFTPHTPRTIDSKSSSTSLQLQNSSRWISPTALVDKQWQESHDQKVRFFS